MSDLGLQIRSYYEDVVERVDPMTPPSPPVSERTYRPLLVLVVTVFLVLIGIGLAPFLARWVAIEPAVEQPSTTTTVASPTTTIAAQDISPTTTVAFESVPLAVFKNPLLVPFFELPACGAHDLLAEWAVARMSAHADLGAWTPVTVENVALVIPVYRDDTIACFDAVQFPDGSMAWAGLDAAGNLVARAVARNADANILDYVDYDALEASGGEYHQDTIGSGQSLTGWVIDGGIEASVRTGGQFRHFIMELPGYELPAPDPQYLQAAAPVLQRLTVNRIEIIRPGAIYLGMTIPDGFVQCVVSHAVAVVPGFDALEQPVRGSAATFCDVEGDTFRIISWDTQADHPEPPPDPMPPDLPPVLPAGQDVSLGGGLTYRAWEDSDGGVTRWYAAAEVPYIGQWMLIEAAPNMTLNDVTTLLASSPWLDPTLANPADGTNDLRDVYSVDWIANILEAIGATNIVEEPQRRAPSSEQDSGPPPIEVVFDHENMEPWHGTIYAWVYEGDSPSPVFATVGSGLNHDSAELDGVTLSFGIGPDGWAMLATANCGGIGITMNIQGDPSNVQSPPPQFGHDPVRDLATRFIQNANC